MPAELVCACNNNDITSVFHDARLYVPWENFHVWRKVSVDSVYKCEISGVSATQFEKVLRTFERSIGNGKRSSYQSNFHFRNLFASSQRTDDGSCGAVRENSSGPRSAKLPHILHEMVVAVCPKPGGPIVALSIPPEPLHKLNPVAFGPRNDDRQSIFRVVLHYSGFVSVQECRSRLEKHHGNFPTRAFALRHADTHPLLPRHPEENNYASITSIKTEPQSQELRCIFR